MFCIDVLTMVLGVTVVWLVSKSLFVLVCKYLTLISLYLYENFHLCEDEDRTKYLYSVVKLVEGLVGIGQQTLGVVLGQALAAKHLEHYTHVLYTCIIMIDNSITLNLHSTCGLIVEESWTSLTRAS